MKSLKKVGNADKKKWLYAFNISPLKSMERAALVVQPPEVTDMPYNAASVAGGGGDDSKGKSNTVLLYILVPGSLIQ